MPSPTLRALRFVHAWYRGTSDIHAEEIQVDRSDGVVPATLFLPPSRRRPLPGWVVLHGVTRPGREHPAIQRFARALASTGAAVLMPEIPEWASLRLAPERAVPTILASILALSARPETEAGDIGLVGFSFGAPQALVAASDPSVAGHLSGVFGFGGYRDLAETLRFQMTGHFRWQGEDLYLRPDPYGRWVVAGNLLTAVPEYSDAEDVSAALLELATIAGDRRVEAWDASFDPVKESLRARIATPRRWLFDLFAPPSGRDPTPEEASSVVERMNEVARTAIPLLDPGPFLPRVTVPVRLMHGREDHLIPFVETLKLVREMEGRTDARATITGLFAHSEDSPVQSAVHRAQDGLVFLRALRSVLVLV